MQPFHIQLWDLLLIQLTNWRWSWRSQLIISTIAPTLSALAFGVFAADDGLNVLGYVLTGHVVLSLLFGIMGQVSGHFAFLRFSGQLEFFATLPISRLALIIATVLAFWLMALPSALATLFIGAWFLKVALVFNPLIFIFLPLIGLSLCGLGAAIGLIARSPNEVNTLSNLSNFVLLFLGPVLIPAERLPVALQWLSYFSPATYAASALRQVLLGNVEAVRLGLDFLVLLGVSCFFLWFVTQRIEWRQ